MRQKYDK